MIMHSMKLNSAMLVAVIFVFSFVHLSDAVKCKVATSDQLYFRTVIMCDSGKVHMNCKKTEGGIRIFKAYYGRPRGVSSKICINEAKNLTACPNVDVKDVLAKRCNRKRHCGFKVMQKTFGIKNTCPTVYKYLEVIYLCWKGYRDKSLKKQWKKQGNFTEEQLVTQGDGTGVQPITIIKDKDSTPTTDPCEYTTTPTEPADRSTLTTMTTKERTTPTPVLPRLTNKKSPKTEIMNTPFVFYQQKANSVTAVQQSMYFVGLLLITVFALVYI